MSIKLKGQKYIVVYDSKKILGKGGNGIVFDALVEGLESEDGSFVVKIYNSNNKNEERYERFKREVKVVYEKLYNVEGVLPIIDYYLPSKPTDKNKSWYLMPKAKNFQINVKKDLKKNWKKWWIWGWLLKSYMI